MEEEWRNIEGYEGLYKVSNYGRVLGVKRNKILKPGVDKGYFVVILYKEGVRKCVRVHRLVAAAFIPNPQNLPQVNHKDEDKKNNFVCVNPNGSVNAAKSNLEYCTNKYNINFGTRNKKVAEKQSKPIVQYDLEGNFIKSWPSAKAVKRDLGISRADICKCCKGKVKTAGGYTWRYK